MPGPFNPRSTWTHRRPLQAAGLRSDGAADDFHEEMSGRVEEEILFSVGPDRMAVAYR